MIIALAVLALALVGQAVLIWRLTRALVPFRHLEERLAHYSDALSLLTETTEAGFRSVAVELERRQGSEPPKTARRPSQRRLAAAVRRGHTVQEIATAEQVAEGEVALRLRLAEAERPRATVHDQGDAPLPPAAKKDRRRRDARAPSPAARPRTDRKDQDRKEETVSGTAYIALSGLRARMEQLDRLASDIANAGTAGYKAERTTTAAAERPVFEQTLNSAIDVAPAPGRLDFRAGTMAPTGRDLDFAIEGSGFFVVDTPAGPRYTRNGNFMRNAEGMLTTMDGMPVQSESGPLMLGRGAITVDASGAVHSGGALVGRLRVVEFDDARRLARDGSTRFRADGITPQRAETVSIKNGALEGSNVAMADRLAQLTEVSRGFGALQRGLSMMMNDIDGRAISELGRR